MKCFSLFLFSLFVSVAYADTYLVMPENSVEKEISLGDILNVTIINEDSSERLPKGKRIGPVFYILEEAGGRKYRVLVSPKKKKVDSSKQQSVELKEDEFVYRGFKFSKDVSSYTNEFVVKDLKYETKDSKTDKMLLVIVALFLLPALVKFAIVLARKVRAKKMLVTRRNVLRKKLKTAKTRADVEELYKHKNDFREILNADEKEINEFVKELNLVQFKKNWEEQDLKVVKKALTHLRQSCNGV